ncbi:MAG: hypothetical protein RDU83_09465 [bacterium]|jgi:hypothetical protein|nr:hypothetical protein [bacterium]
MSQDIVLVPIPATLHRRIETALEQLGHASVEAFVVHAVRSALAPHEAVHKPTPGDEAAIIERLRRLGYID